MINKNTIRKVRRKKLFALKRNIMAFKIQKKFREYIKKVKAAMLIQSVYFCTKYILL